MHPRFLASLVCVFPLLLTCASAGAAADPTPYIDSNGVQTPVVLKGPQVEWPGFPDREALVRIRFRVRADGTASDFEVLEGGFHEKRFVTAALAGMKKARYKPAMKNGVPLDDYYGVQPINFVLGTKPATGITKDFRTELNTVATLIRKGDNAGAHFHAEWMLAEKAKLLYEYAVLQAQLAQTHASVGNVHRALTAARAGSQRKSPAPREFTIDQLVIPNNASYYMLPKELVINLLDLRFRLAASKGMLLESIEAYQELAGLQDIPADSPYVQTATNIVTKLKSDQPLVAQLRVDESRELYHQLFRRTFSLSPKAGTVEKIALVCAGKERDLPYQQGVEWTLPAGWQKCSVRIRAEPGVEFDLIEYQPGTEAVVLP